MESLYFDVTSLSLFPLINDEWISVYPNVLTVDNVLSIESYKYRFGTNPNDKQPRPSEDIERLCIYNPQVDNYKDLTIIVWEGFSQKISAKDSFRIVSFNDALLIAQTLNQQDEIYSTKKNQSYSKRTGLIRSRHLSMNPDLYHDKNLASLSCDQAELDELLDYPVTIRKSRREFHKNNPLYDFWSYRNKPQQSWKTSGKSKRQWQRHKKLTNQLTIKDSNKSIVYPSHKIDTLSSDDNGKSYKQGTQKLKDGDLVLSPYFPEIGIFKIIKNNNSEFRLYRNCCSASIAEMPAMVIVRDKSVNWDEWEDIEFMDHHQSSEKNPYCWINFDEKYKPHYDYTYVM